MAHEKKAPPPAYTCREYREEMIMLALQKRLQQTDLTVEEREKLLAEIASLSERIGF